MGGVTASIGLGASGRGPPAGKSSGKEGVAGAAAAPGAEAAGAAALKWERSLRNQSTVYFETMYVRPSKVFSLARRSSFFVFASSHCFNSDSYWVLADSIDCLACSQAVRASASFFSRSVF